MSTTTPVETTAQDAGPNKPTDEFIRALRRRGRQFRRAEAARKAQLQYRVRIERAVLPKRRPAQHGSAPGGACVVRRARHSETIFLGIPDVADLDAAAGHGAESEGSCPAAPG